MRKTLTLPKLKAVAQTTFNRYIRNRDRDLGCISCGGKIDHAGHYFSSGHYSALTFDEDNVHGQCLKCNNFLHGNLINYRMGLVDRYGDKFVIKLESKSKNKLYKYSREELQDIINKYK
jgi:gamma-glutamylcyclotransferase (GGCT)/AIG2-like uncharacterized protein YtfP